MVAVTEDGVDVLTLGAGDVPLLASGQQPPA